MTAGTLPFSLVDVFASSPLSGNGLSVFLLEDALPASLLQRITQEMRQFETIFLRRLESDVRFQARIFTMEEELPFAGHPIIGAAAFLHAELFSAQSEAPFELVAPEKSVRVTSRREGKAYFAEMDQGAAAFWEPIARTESEAYLQALNLSGADLSPGLPLQVVSTGLPYLIVPVQANLEGAHIVQAGFEAMLAKIGARFVYVLDTARREGRTWDNDGRVEDIATGSAAGPAGAYMARHGLAQPGEDILIHQGRFLNRPSVMRVRVAGGGAVMVSGQVCFVGRGEISLPEPYLTPRPPLHGVERGRRQLL